MAFVNLPTTGPLEAVGLATDGVLASGPALVVVGIDDGEAGDDGGWKRTLAGTFPLHLGCYVNITDGADIDERCYSGVVGEGNLCQSLTGGDLPFTVPPLPLGTYNITVVTEDGLSTATLTDGIEIVARDFSTRLYGMRAAHPPPRDVGAYDIRDEEVPS